MKKLLCCALAVLLLALVGCDNGGQIVEKVDTSENSQSETNSNEGKPYYEQFADSKCISVELAQSMDECLGEVTAKYMSTSKYSLKNISKQSFKQVEDWAYGERYYGYLDDQYVIYFYCEGDEVASIRTSNGDFVYKKDE